jgi:hypothetical protein
VKRWNPIRIEIFHDEHAVQAVVYQAGVGRIVTGTAPDSRRAIEAARVKLSNRRAKAGGN